MRTPAIALISLVSFGAAAQVVGPSINMVTGTSWPDGDPFLQRQNEPSLAISSRNSLHLLAGANDYRTVDLPGVPDDRPTGDAWLGVFKSLDGGLTWKSTLIPGYPQDKSADGAASILKGMDAGADPVVRAGTNGLFYFGGLAFQRAAGGKSRIFAARYIDDNNAGSGDTLRYLGTTLVREGDATHFEDKPAFAADIPRKGALTCTIPGVAGGVPGQAFAGGRVFAAWTEFLGDPKGSGTPAQILFSRSDDCGATWSTARAISGTDPINQGAAIAVNQKTGAVYVAWRVFGASTGSIMFAASPDNGNSFDAPLKIADFTPLDQGTTPTPNSNTFSFRTNAYPSIAVDGDGPLGDGNGAVYIAWSQRMGGPQGDARIVVGTAPLTNPERSWECVFASPTCAVFTTAQTVDSGTQRGHQFMPALNFSNGKLTAAWYDLRDTNTIGIYTPLPKAAGSDGPPQYDEMRRGQGDFGPFIADVPRAQRHTLDVMIAQTTVRALTPVWGSAIKVSRYAFGTRSGKTEIQQLELDAPNLPMFQLGTVPFFGDYIDLAGSTFIANSDGTWRFNNKAGDPENLHVAWTDNRNVVPPRDGNWTKYTPLALAAGMASGVSLYDPTKSPDVCAPGQAGIRNQDVYTARISGGLVVSAKSTAKPLGFDPANPQQLIQRTFPVTVHNTSLESRSFRLDIASQPAGGQASFLQFSEAQTAPNTQVTVRVPPLSIASRAIFMTARDPYASVQVNVTEVDGTGAVLADGLKGNVAINQDGTLPAITGQNVGVKEIFNPDISNPDISNPDISNPDISNPDISNPDISNPDISNPDISNPDISNPAFRNPDISNPDISNLVVANPDISNPDISNPDISNPDISNVRIANPDISNPDISNPDISNSALSDATWAVTNRGNTPTTYLLKFLENQPVPRGVDLQLLISKRYNTPVADGCTRKIYPHYVVLANIANPKFSTAANLTSASVADPATADVPSVAVSPGERILVTIRALDRTTTDPVAARLHYDPSLAVTPVVVPESKNTGATDPTLPLTIVTTTLPTGRPGQAYSQALAAAGGTAPYSWSMGPSQDSSLPSGLKLDATGLISGTPDGSGSVYFWAYLTDSTGRITRKMLLLNVQPTEGGVAIVTPSPLASGAVGISYSQTLSASGGSAPYTWRLVSGTLPPGLTLNASGFISGAPTSAGLFGFALRATDSARGSDTRTLAIIVRANSVSGPPVINSVASAAPGAPSIAGGSWVSIYGSGLSGTSRSWGASDFSGKALPLSLDGVSVTIDGKPAAVSYISATQINVLSPLLSKTGPVEVRVTNGRGTASGTATAATYAPALFLFPDLYVAAVHNDGTYVGKPGLFPVAPTSTRPAKPGEIISLYGSGFGPTIPVVNPAELFLGAAPLVNGQLLRVTIGGLTAAVQFAGISSPGLYQFNIVVPPTLADGDQGVVMQIGDATSPSGRLITVAR